MQIDAGRNSTTHVRSVLLAESSVIQPWGLFGPDTNALRTVL
jgi:hypothetical protein